MSNRTLVTYEETRPEPNPRWAFTLDIQRSASGLPTLLFTIGAETPDGIEREELTIVVDNADEVLRPALEWLEVARERQSVVSA